MVLVVVVCGRPGQDAGRREIGGPDHDLLGLAARRLGLHGRRLLNGLGRRDLGLRRLRHRRTADAGVGLGRALGELLDRGRVGLRRERHGCRGPRVERLGDPGDRLAGAGLGVAGTLLGVVDAAQHLVQAALAVGLLAAELGEALGALGALLGLTRLRLDLLEPGLRILQCLLSLALVGLDRRLGAGQLGLHLLVALAPALDLLVGHPQLSVERARVGGRREGLRLGPAGVVGCAELRVCGATLGRHAHLLDLADPALGVGVGLTGACGDDRVVLPLLGIGDPLGGIHRRARRNRGEGVGTLRRGWGDATDQRRLGRRTRLLRGERGGDDVLGGRLRGNGRSSGRRRRDRLTGGWRTADGLTRRRSPCNRGAARGSLRLVVAASARGGEATGSSGGEAGSSSRCRAEHAAATLLRCRAGGSSLGIGLRRGALGNHLRELGLRLGRLRGADGRGG